MRKVSFFALFFVPLIASAHAFGEKYSLPLPVSFYITGGVAAFIASCAFLILIEHPTSILPSKEGRRLIVFSERSWKTLIVVIQAGLLVLFILGIATGFFGSQEASNNPLIFLFWLGLVLAVPYLSLIVSGWWEIGNPFRTIVSLFVRRSSYMPWAFGYTPAIIGYVLLIVLELFLPEWGTNPRLLAVLILLYTAYLGIGSFRYGFERWFRYADLFSVFFRLAAAVAPLRLAEGRVSVASPAVRLMTTEAGQASLTVFIVFGLAATAFDGFRETQTMHSLALTIPALSLEAWSFLVFALIPVLFWGFFYGAVWLMRKIAGGERLAYVIPRFGLSLIPILLAYHFAHYFPLLFSSGPYIVPLLADPFGTGWNLLGLGGYTAGMLIEADTIWYLQLAVIVLGHAFAAYIAHKLALAEFSEKKTALLSQIPLILLMVFYTAFGLWILSQPFAGI